MSLLTDEPTVLPIGTDVSAKYKGAFCEAKIKKITRNVKCKLTVKDTNSLATVDDELIVSGSLRAGSHVVFKHNGQPTDAIVNKILDQSFYTVVFDDGDEATLKRSSLCLKSGKHFAESETLDQLPLTNPEHFGNPVSLGRRRRRRHHNSDSDEEDVDESESRSPPERDADWGKVVCVDYGDKRGSKKDIWFPALIVAPTAQDATTKMAKDEHLVRSFRDGRFYKVNKKDAREFTKETVSKSESNSSALRSAMEKAVVFTDKQELPNHWDYDLLMGNTIPQIEEEVETSEDFDSALDDSDDEQSEEKDRFVAQLYKYMDERGTPINRAPSVGGKDLNLYKLYRIVVKMGGYNRVTNKNSWRIVYSNLGLPASSTPSGKESAAVLQLKAAYKKFLHSFDDFYRKLGCTITVNSRTSRPSRGERIREDRPISEKKKSVKKEKESKKEELKEEKEKKESPISTIGSGDVVAKGPKGKEEKEKEKPEKEKEKETPVKEEVKPEEVKTVIKEKEIVRDIPKEDIKIKTEDSPSLDERKRGRGRKKRDEPHEEPPQDEDTMTGQSTIDESDEDDHKSSKIDESMIKVGDGLKVKYGRGRQLKVYEAKVLKIEMDAIKNKQKYFVHYSGWNSRYDEWIKKSRIVTVIRDRSPRRRSGKLKNKGETLQEVSTIPPNSGNNNQSSAMPSMSSQNSVSSNDESSLQSLQSQPPKRGRPPNSGKSNAIKELTVKEEPKTQEKQSQPSPQSSQSTDTKVGRRGRPPLSAKKEKLTRSKSINDDQSTNESFATSSIFDELISKPIDEKKNVTNLSSDSEVMDRPDDKEAKAEKSVETPQKKAVQPPELHDENTVENKLADEESIVSDFSPVAIKVEQIVEQTPNKTVVSESDESVSPPTLQKQENEDKREPQTTPVKDAFDFDDEEVLKEEEPLKEQLKKKRKSKDDGKKGSNKSSDKSSTDKNEKTSSSKEITNEDNSVRDNGRSNSFTRKSTKKSRKSAAEPVVEKPIIADVPPPVAEELPPPLTKELPVKAEEEEKSKTVPIKATKSLPSSVEIPPQKQPEPKPKRKGGRKRKDSESVTPVKKKIKPTKLELHEEDSNLEVQKLFESYSSSTPPQESDISPVEEMKVLPLFTTDINPPQHESVSSDFLICEEAVPASPEKVPQPDEHMDDSMPLHESPHSFHSSPTQSPQELVHHKEAKGSGGSNSELENEPIVSAKDSTNKMEMFPSPTHDEDSMISRPECNKSPISPKKRRRGRMRTTSQSDSYPKERIGCKTRGSSGRTRAERHSPLTALEHRMPFSSTPILFHNFVPESKYNFCIPLDESIDADKRINILQERLQELRKTYMNIKQEVAVLERKKKKARRKEKERKDVNNSHKHNSNHSHNSTIVDNFNPIHNNSTHKVLSTVPYSSLTQSTSASIATLPPT